MKPYLPQDKLERSLLDFRLYEPLTSNSMLVLELQELQGVSGGFHMEKHYCDRGGGACTNARD